MTEYKEDIEHALKTDNPIDALCAFVLQLNNQRIKKEEIYDLLLQYSLSLSRDNRAREAELLEDVMDRVSGWYVGKNLNLD